jgi:hypothetical protein
VPAFHLHRLALQLFVRAEECGDFERPVRLHLLQLVNAVKRGSSTGTARIFSSEPFASTVSRVPMGRARRRQPVKVRSSTTTRMFDKGKHNFTEGLRTVVYVVV